MLKYTNTRVVSLRDWDTLVQKTYKRPYCFQQQDGGKSRGTFHLTVPSEYAEDSEMNDSISEKVNGKEMGVKFNVWLSRDPKRPIKDQKYEFELDLFWSRNFYPDIHTLANDLHKKGLIKAGEYSIDINW